MAIRRRAEAPALLSLHTGEVVGSIPTAPTIIIKDLAELASWSCPHFAHEIVLVRVVRGDVFVTAILSLGRP
jgi:hypothetical protein